MSLPKKSLGQHWLHDEMALEAMAESAGVEAGDFVLEIGPGLGTLTQILLDRGAEVHAVEFDTDLLAGLKGKFSANPKFSLENIDILKFDYGKLPVGYKVAANIPYYLTSNLLRQMCEAINPFSRAALLIQKEVAERVCAGPGDMSLLSVSVQFYCQVGLGDLVPASLFTPPPKVDSQILELEYVGPRYDVDTEKFFSLVKAGFSERRKKLRSSLSGGLKIGKPQAEALLQKAGVDPNLRAQALSLEDWHRLYLASA